MSEPLDEPVGKLEIGIARLVESYAQHHPSCWKVRARWHGLVRPCSCGLDESVEVVKSSLARTRAAIREAVQGLRDLADDGK